MESESQRIERLQKMSSVLKSMKDCSNIKEIEEKTGVPRSTIQRYLNRPDYYEDLVTDGYVKRENIENLMDYTKEWLNKSKHEGLKRGGTISQEKYGFSKGEDGKFNGHTR